jgi:transaldolase
VKIFLDTANVKEIKKWMDMGVIDGVTTNPSILKKDGTPMEEVIKAVKGLPLSLEVTTNNLDEMVKQAEGYFHMYSGVAVKIPVQTQDGELCYGVINHLRQMGITVNATVCMSFGQVVLAVKAGATYISIFAGRVGDEGGNPPEVIRNSVEWLTRWGYINEIIVGSIRSVRDVLEAIIAGAHIITIPPDILAKMANHMYTRETVRQFIADAQK